MPGPHGPGRKYQSLSELLAYFPGAKAGKQGQHHIPDLLWCQPFQFFANLCKLLSQHAA